MQDLIHSLRDDYRGPFLLEEHLDPDPIKQFHTWFGEVASQAEGFEANAMTLATADASGAPSARVLLLKGVDHGFVFYTNYESRKAGELEVNPRAAMVFYWPSLARQVRVEGTVEKVSSEQSDAYFASRPSDSQVGAWASRQGRPLTDRGQLDQAAHETARQFGADPTAPSGGCAPPAPPIPRPDFWGGYRLLPHRVEFWQGRPSRLHDRLVYQRTAGEWVISRLSP